MGLFAFGRIDFNDIALIDDHAAMMIGCAVAGIHCRLHTHHLVEPIGAVAECQGFGLQPGAVGGDSPSSRSNTRRRDLWSQARGPLGSLWYRQTVDMVAIIDHIGADAPIDIIAVGRLILL